MCRRCASDLTCRNGLKGHIGATASKNAAKTALLEPGCVHASTGTSDGPRQ